jgi:acetaldehyde dehydrogenase
MRVAIVGTGNIGSDLLEKLRRSDTFEVAIFAGIDPDSPGLSRARGYGVPTSTNGIEAVLELADSIDLVYEATSAAVHRANAPRYEAAGLTVVDLTPAKLGPAVVPAVNIQLAFDAPNVNLTTCGGQATVPMVAAVRQVSPVEYAEIVSTVASNSAGPGTRQNIDEFTQTTADALRTVGGADAGKAIIILNPADPPILMRNTVFCIVPGSADRAAIEESVREMVARVQEYVPGYRLVAGPEFDELDDGRTKTSVFLEVTGAGDFLPPYAGNLDIMTAAAVAVGEQLALSEELVRA